MKYYVLFVEGDVEPSLVGPFDNEEERDAEARRVRAENDENGVYALEVTPDGIPAVRSYGASEIDSEVMDEEDA